MGEVYRATDTKLGRDVALKVLPADLARDPERLARFQREARAVAALNHPHIVTIFSVEEADGLHFLTMELVEGQSLDRLIRADGLPVEQIIEIAGALADALAAAHEKGIVHRDLKPANVMVTNEGRVKVLDFGLAKEYHAANPGDATLTAAHQTEAGVVMGTPAYMSPEQIAGRPLDHRTDIFSLGVVLHEMATGRRPFEGTSSAELASAILRDTPPSVTDVRVNLPGDLARIIRRCLEKDPRHRVQTARDVGNDFRDLARQTSQAVRASRPVAKPDSGASRAEEGFWVAVLLFKYKGAGPELEALAEGITEEIITGLSRFSYLRVIARGSTAKYSSESGDIRAIGKELGARYVMEGSIRQVGSTARLAVQLVDAMTGAHLWAETFDRAFRPEEIFALQDDLVPRVVSTVADMHGVLPRSMSEAVRLKAADQMSPYEALLRSFGYNERFTPEDLSEVRTCLERAVQQAPGNADCWAMLSLMYANEYGHWDNAGPDSLERALRAARRAVEAAPLSSLPYYALAQALFFRREIPAFRVAAERAVSLNPMDGATAAFMGLLIAYAGDWERGCALSEKGAQLNPNHPGWYRYTAWHDAYRKKDYRGALDVALKLNAPKNFYTHSVLAICYAQLGQMEEARSALRDLLALKPDYAQVARELHGRWVQPDLVEQLMDGLRKAGLEVTADSGRPAPSPTRTTSGKTRAEEGFWVAVLPFKYSGANADLTALAEGLSEEIVTGLSRFSYLKVISRSSTVRYARESVDVRSAGKELGARYVMEGSIRQAASKLRIAVQLVDASSGAHLWA
ncbi:MAG: protein kinase domain-containing protein, partial [Terriglobales bacterium]